MSAFGVPMAGALSPRGRGDTERAQVTVGAVALTIPGTVSGWPWSVRTSSHRAALALADRHYSRQSVGSPWIGPPGKKLTLVSPCERAVWLSSYTFYPDDGLTALRCSIFRNEGAGLSSHLIREAMLYTERVWADLPAPDAWVTWVDVEEVASPNPGYCFKRAGWWLDRSWTRDGRIRLRSSLIGPSRAVIRTVETPVNPDSVDEGCVVSQDTPARCDFSGFPEPLRGGAEEELDGRGGQYEEGRTA